MYSHLSIVITDVLVIFTVKMFTRKSDNLGVFQVVLLTSLFGKSFILSALFLLLRDLNNLEVSRDLISMQTITLILQIK